MIKRVETNHHVMNLGLMKIRLVLASGLLFFPLSTDASFIHIYRTGFSDLAIIKLKLDIWFLTFDINYLNFWISLLYSVKTIDSIICRVSLFRGWAVSL